MRRFALLSPQGTACPETVLTQGDYTFLMRMFIEGEFCKGGPDDPVPRTWTDVTDNQACTPDTEDDTEDDTVIEMRLCETQVLLLKPDQLYRFTVDENCARCVAHRNAALGK